MRLPLVFLAVLGLASSSPAPATTPKDTNFLATFEPPEVPGSALVPELKLIPVPYQKLAWNAQVGFKDLITRLPPKSGKQVDAIFIGDNILYQDRTNITIKYPGSNTKSFTLKSLFQGCVLPTQNGLAPTSCTVRYTGTKIAGKGGQVIKDFTYEVGSQLNPNPLKAVTFPAGFKDLESVNIEFVPPITTVKNVLFLDDVAGTTFE